ncbi:hypothetical protein LYNGBM3L_02850 [Moorena producens 3L]|uniref:Uncharacterized protein n=1 Tax=Moorena producens 3L TaxID=489825 RepID=F4XIQ0_9CYAN|nr:hypothetical protein LYNGBM3L_02850 [Moorena producens 3L]
MWWRNWLAELVIWLSELSLLLAKGQGKARCSNQLEPLDSWNIKKLTGKFAVQVLKDS